MVGNNEVCALKGRYERLHWGLAVWSRGRRVVQKGVIQFGGGGLIISYVVAWPCTGDEFVQGQPTKLRWSTTDYTLRSGAPNGHCSAGIGSFRTTELTVRKMDGEWDLERYCSSATSAISCQKSSPDKIFLHYVDSSVLNTSRGIRETAISQKVANCNGCFEFLRSDWLGFIASLIGWNPKLGVVTWSSLPLSDYIVSRGNAGNQREPFFLLLQRAKSDWELPQKSLLITRFFFSKSDNFLIAARFLFPATIFFLTEKKSCVERHKKIL